MRIFSYIFLLLIISFGVSFAVLNSTAVPINYYVGANQAPLSLLLVIAFALGCLLGILVGLWMVVKMKFSVYRLRQRLQLAEKEIENLRAIPLQDQV